MSETLREKWFEKCGYNPLSRIHTHYDYSLHYYNVDTKYVSYMHQQFPESRRDSRRRTKAFMEWFKASEYWEKDVLLVGHGFSVKDCLNNLGINPPYQGWNGSFPAMGHLFTVGE
jgi:broad specificity phosphatase PhoE